MNQTVGRRGGLQDAWRRFRCAEGSGPPVRPAADEIARPALRPEWGNTPGGAGAGRNGNGRHTCRPYAWRKCAKQNRPRPPSKMPVRRGQGPALRPRRRGPWARPGRGGIHAAPAHGENARNKTGHGRRQKCPSGGDHGPGRERAANRTPGRAAYTRPLRPTETPVTGHCTFPMNSDGHPVTGHCAFVLVCRAGVHARRDEPCPGHPFPRW